MKRIAYAIITALALTACQESLEERCAREAEEYTKKKGPARIDQNPVIYSLVFERATHTMHYYYTLTGTADDPKTFTMFNAENVMLTQLKNSTMIKTYKDAGYSFAYTYHSKKEKGRILFEKTFTKEDYK